MAVAGFRAALISAHSSNNTSIFAVFTDSVPDALAYNQQEALRICAAAAHAVPSLTGPMSNIASISPNNPSCTAVRPMRHPKQALCNAHVRALRTAQYVLAYNLAFHCCCCGRCVLRSLCLRCWRFPAKTAHMTQTRIPCCCVLSTC